MKDRIDPTLVFHRRAWAVGVATWGQRRLVTVYRRGAEVTVPKYSAIFTGAAVSPVICGIDPAFSFVPALIRADNGGCAGATDPRRKWYCWRMVR